MPALKRKAFACVTHRASGGVGGERLLIFGHPNAPEAGLQVPAGTIDGVPPLIAGHDHYLSLLIERLRSPAPGPAPHDAGGSP